ncbi:MAG: cyclic pyranopterin monophosphate synthase MoaC [Acidimicrobiia bacterium]|nr:cyclic pyranopterin monophosphate synthase MoaC [Acidimicrobiia bacterium]
MAAGNETRMISVGEKAETERRAVAEARLVCAPETLRRIAASDLPKGNALATARVAAVLAAKHTPDIVPLCHPLPLTGVDVEIEVEADHVLIRVTVETVARTGVEMEALTGASVAALTIYDMVKGIDRWLTIESVSLLEKSGGRSGHWVREV